MTHHIIGDTAPSDGKAAHDGVTAFVTIMRGCDNHCTYCVVPFVRGSEVSRRPEAIVAEIKALVESGVREVTLLGQNVNSYGQKEGIGPFHKLLALVDAIDGLWRIRFTTSHPKDLSDDLIDCFGHFTKLCHHIHLPVQTGSNRLLRLMNRHYTREHYLEQIARLRRHCPGIAITSDVIVGFPGETEEDFRQTLDLIKRIDYDSLFMFRYSDRPQAPAARFGRKVSEPEKQERLEELMDLQNRVTIRKNRLQIGSTLPVLVEGMSKKQDDVGSESHPGCVRWTGRSSTNRVVNFVLVGDGSRCEDIRGRMTEVEITQAFPHSLWGESAGPQAGPDGLIGEEPYAA